MTLARKWGGPILQHSRAHKDPANLLTGAKHPEILTNHLADIDKTKHIATVVWSLTVDAANIAVQAFILSQLQLHAPMVWLISSFWQLQLVQNATTRLAMEIRNASAPFLYLDSETSTGC